MDNLNIEWKIDRAEQFLELLQTHSWNDAVQLLKDRIGAEAKELRKAS